MIIETGGRRRVRWLFHCREDAKKYLLGPFLWVTPNGPVDFYVHTQDRSLWQEVPYGEHYFGRISAFVLQPVSEKNTPWFVSVARSLEEKGLWPPKKQEKV